MNDTTVVSELVEIDAPASQVWAVMVDFERYPEWNPFTIKVEATLELGSPVVLTLPDPAKPGDTFTTLEQISAIVPNEHLQYNTGDSIPGVHAVRDQWVKDLGNGRCSYQTTDIFTGEHARVAFDLQGAWVTEGFTATAWALKARAEELWLRAAEV
ncbi:MAG: hypothetical protein JWO12_2706 [Frankiales bacterium]|nr:hypothetical protein [Frankiales bacterium]